MRRVVLIVLGVALAALALSGLAAGSPRLPASADVFKGPMDPTGKIRFVALESKSGKVPWLDHFRLRFDCNDGLGLTGLGYGASPGSQIRPDERGRFRIRGEANAGDPELTLALDGDFNRRFTKASGTFRFRGNVGDGVHTDCDTGKLAWQVKLQP